MIGFRGRNIATPTKWTSAAVQCYQIGCICKNCDMYEIIGDKCSMKDSVVELVKKIGIPGEDNVENG
ncbi:MAG: hypothetical protein PHV37_09120 [Candidatus Gastranaerophilales bacterium]|nr:hypothetical protein [Candidatus Gastranaerophilales bacterium]